VFELCHYGGLTQAEAARVLGQPPRTVSRLYVAAAEALKEFAPGRGG
jgi:DNA-directed RNA polymerase specialized sigma24 family protein